MIASQNLATTMLNAGIASYNNSSLKIYQGEVPVTPEFNASPGSVLLATFTFAGTAFSGPTFITAFGMASQATFASNSVTPAAAGTACYALAVTTGGTILEQRTMGMPWAPSLTVIPYQFIYANSNTYICGAGGVTASNGIGPSGTGNVIADGTAAWKWYAAGAPDIQLTEAVLSTSGALSMPQFWLIQPCL